VHVIDTCNPLYLSKCQTTVPQLQALSKVFKRFAEDPAVSPEQRYALAMNDGCYGRIELLFEELEVSLPLGDLSPHILGHEVCLHLIGEAFMEQLNGLSCLLAEPA